MSFARYSVGRAVGERSGVPVARALGGFTMAGTRGPRPRSGGSTVGRSTARGPPCSKTPRAPSGRSRWSTGPRQSRALVCRSPRSASSTVAG
eukprot:12022995-Alexandrium_andersonii.AAC.1